LLVHSISLYLIQFLIMQLDLNKGGLND